MSYWDDREQLTKARLTDKTIEQTNNQLIKYYLKTQQKIIGQFEETYNHLLLSIAEGRKPTPADLYKLDKYWELQKQTKEELDKLGVKQHTLLSKQFVKEYEDIYNSIAIKGLEVYTTMDTAKIEEMINRIWCADGKSWSERIWKNVEDLQSILNENLLHCVVSGTPSSELKKLLQKGFGVSFTRADTLVRTELAHIQVEAARQRYEDYGIKEVEILADPDERRCDYCGSLHGKRYSIYAKVPLPAHPRCRCDIIPVVE